MSTDWIHISKYVRVMLKEIIMEQTGNTKQHCCINACMVEYFVYVSPTTSHHTGEAYDRETLPFHFLTN